MREEKLGNSHNVRLERFLDDIKTVVRDGQVLLKAGVGSMKEKARLGAASTDRFVKEQPYYGIGMAFGVGVLTGLVAAGLLKRSGGNEE